MTGNPALWRLPGVLALLRGGYPDYADHLLAAAVAEIPGLAPALATLRAGDAAEAERQVAETLAAAEARATAQAAALVA